MEADKSILTLSTASLGFVISYILSDKISSWYAFFLFVLGGICFFLCSAAVIYTLHKNADYIASPKSDGKLLALLDKAVRASFFIGLFLTGIAALSTAIPSINNRIDQQEVSIEPRSTEQKSTKSEQSSHLQGQLGGSELYLTPDSTSKSPKSEQQKIGESPLTPRAEVMTNRKSAELV
ncbi:hypothetical protein [Enterovibrio norvegicus]|uniref:Uncharacterized protein n=1 Tax=Enterovibrio norvegicus TaxID=188144 RepID=A0ABV4KVV2_9GAMM|nr:hypothetical protein [Enterovibrio norvegicus]